MSSNGRPTPLATAAYLLMIAASVAAFLVVRHYGEVRFPPEAAVAPSHAAPEAVSQVLLHVLLALAAVMLVGRGLGRLFHHIHQPPVIGEVLAGILLGPSLLGRIAPDVSAYLLPASVAPYLGVIAQLGVILYMFTVGLELNAELLQKRGHATVAISHASILAPFLLGALLALAIYPVVSSRAVPFTAFALFLGVSMSVTAFPVLARILADRHMTRTELGVIALTCAATDDVTAWCLLAFVVGVARAELEGALLTCGLTLAYIALMFLVVRPLVARWTARVTAKHLTLGGVSLVLAAVLLSALATEMIGVHAIFGAFLLGAVIPHDSVVARELTHKLSDVVAALLLPAFFALTGMRTKIGLVSGSDHWLLVAAIILVATAGKFGGTLVAARLTGLDWRQSSALGILMNTRGLMELIVLNIGLDLKVISETLFAMMVLMALVTTLATTPLLTLVERKSGRDV
jgi:K+:H+ antiporter